MALSKHSSMSITDCGKEKYVQIPLHYSAARTAIKHHFVLNSVLQNNSDLYKFHYAITTISQY
jgi:hypothetical protein